MSSTSASRSASSGVDILQGVIPLLGRILLALIYVMSGVSKIMEPGATIDHIAAAGLPLPTLGYAIALLAEVVGGIALVVGYQTRITAAGLAVYTLAAAVFFHNPFADHKMFIHFFKNVAMTGGFLQIVAFGAGSLSLDARR